MKQSSIDWLIEQLTEMGCLSIYYGSNSVTTTIEQAKEKHKNEIIDAWCDGANPDKDNTIYARDYYNETYGND